MRPDGSDQRRVTPEAGQFVAWSPDGRYLLVSGRALYVSPITVILNWKPKP